MTFNRQCCWLAVLLWLNPIWALWVFGQISLDGSVGPGIARDLQPVGNEFQVGADLGTVISSGASANLFHSFGRFNVNTGQSAIFTGPSHITNVLARVTGHTPSHIRGLLATSGMPNANFFLMNPNGVIFGSGAKLDVGGSFTVTTADALELADGGRFTASIGANDSMLTSAPPEAFGFLGGPEARVVVNSDLINDDGISIRAGSVEISGGSMLSTIRGGDIELIGSHQVVLSGINRNGSSAGVLTLHLPFGQSGSIHVEAPIVRLDNGASISTTLDNLFGTDGADVDIIASESITLSGVGDQGKGAIISATSTFFASGNAGTILLKAPRIWLDDGAAVSADTFGNGSAGNIEFIASESILLSGANGNGLASSVMAGTLASGSGDAGTILFDAPRIHLEDGASVDTSTTESGPAGNIEMMAAEAITLSGTSKSGSGSTIASRTFSVGNAGSIKVEAPLVALEDGAQIATSTTSTGDGGAVDFKVDQLHMRNEASLAASSDQVTDGAGTAGNITVLATGSVVINDQSKIATSAANADGGNISVSTGHNLELTNSQMTAQAAQNGGNITIVAPNILRLQDSQIDVQANRDGGDITIDPLLVDLRGRSAITADAVAGSGGNITIQTTILHQSSASRITASSMFGVSGTVNVNSTLDLTGSLVDVSASLLDLDAQLQPHCAVQFGVGEVSTFVVSGRGGTPLAPNRWQPSVNLAAPPHTGTIDRSLDEPGHIGSDPIRTNQAPPRRP